MGKMKKKVVGMSLGSAKVSKTKRKAEEETGEVAPPKSVRVDEDINKPVVSDEEVEDEGSFLFYWHLFLLQK